MISRLEPQYFSPSIIITILVLAYTLRKLWQHLFAATLDLAPNVPIVGKPTDISFEAAIREGDRLYPNGVYQIPLPQMPHVFFPFSAMMELYSCSSASFPAHSADILLGKYTYQGEENIELKAGIRLMSNNLDVVIKSFEADVGYAFRETFGECKDWTTVEQLWPSAFKLAAILSSRPFLGQSLSRDPEWFAAVVEYARTLSDAVGSLRPVPRLIRLLFEERLPRIRALVKARDRMEEMMTPLINEHIARWRSNDRVTRSKRQSPISPDGGELLDWIIPQYESPVAKKLARDEITVILESMLNLSTGMSHVLYNIAKHHQYQQPLREEYQQSMIECGEMNKAALFKMKKMDSFMKETQRMNPPALMGIQRKVVDPKGMQLSVGPRIPCGTLVAVSSDRINRSPEFYPNPMSFDGYRFFKMREETGEEFKHQLVSTSEREMNFSIGGRACPGRMFFSAMEKIVLSYVLMNYDIRVKPGHEKEDSRITEGVRVPPNPKAIMQLRKKVKN